MKQVKVLFVCMGNICRSPTAHGIFQHLVDQAGLSDHIIVESAGTIGYHAGENPDPRARAMSQSRGVDISKQIARQVRRDDYAQQTYILAMDYSNLQNLNADCPEPYQDKIELLLSYHPDDQLQEVPDPYYGGDRGFENVYNMIEVANKRLLQSIRNEHEL